MNCRTAKTLLAQEPDGALTTDERAALADHLTACPSCQHVQTSMVAVLDHWKTRSSTVPIPDAERAWQDIRRELRGGARAPAPLSWSSARWAIGAGAAAAAAIAFFTLAPSGRNVSPTVVAQLDRARADFVEVPNSASSMVYVDDASGWLVVWAVSDASGG
jgi:anti-sigma factor RsiW